MSAATDTPTTAAAPAVAGKTARLQQFPLKYHFSITPAMGNALRRMTGPNSPYREADIGRLALHQFLLQNDPQYARQVSNGAGNHA